MISGVTPWELSEKKGVFQVKNTYNPRVKVGFWYPSQSAIVEDNERMEYLKCKGKLPRQMYKRMIRNLMKPTKLGLESTFVMYGENYQIRAFYVRDIHCKEVYISGIMNNRDIEHGQHLDDNCDVTAAHSAEPVVRNTFKILPMDPNRFGGQVLFGDDVCFQLAECHGPPLYLQFESINIDTFGELQERQPLKLSKYLDMYCKFKIFHGNPDMRVTTLAGTIKHFSRVIIQHSASGTYLSVEPKWVVQTFFGPEMTVSCHTYRDCFKNDGPQNFFEFVAMLITDFPAPDEKSREN